MPLNSEQPKLPQEKFPWVPLVLLVIGILVFWVLPFQLKDRSQEIQFSAR
ncbi:MAG: hypothetical protein JST40_00705 [Armatimonadetes bacterium]|nr:hypothetical protein [Armatimonadota bacterium]